MLCRGILFFISVEWLQKSSVWCVIYFACSTMVDLYSSTWCVRQLKQLKKILKRGVWKK